MTTRTSAPPSRSEPSGVRVIRLGAFSFRVRLRVAGLVAVAAVVVVGLMAWSLTLGNYALSLAEIYGALKGTASADARFIVVDLRLPRLLTAVAVGSMLAMSGAIFQGILRNPLVSPDIIGINAGASVGALLLIVTRQPLAYLPAAAFVGGLVAAAAIYALTWRGHISGARLILVGMGMNAMLTATTTYLLTQAEIRDASRAVLWMAGSVYGSDWGDVRLLVVSLAVLVPLGAALMWSLRVLQLGDLTAHTLGMPVERIRLFLIITGCALSGIAVSVAGPIGFVALMVPHFARMLAGPMTAGVFVLTGLLGAALVLGADMIGQHATGVSLPVGVITSALGAPYFLYLLSRTRVRL